MTHVYKLHGLPEAIISDRDRVFTSKLWQELFKLTNTQLLMSSSYHPQTDGQIEHLNQCLETFLRCSIHSCPKQWFKWFHWLSFGTTHNFILPCSTLHLRYYMAILPVILALLTWMLVQCQNWNSGLRRDIC